jgi:hypothetical protein
MGMDALDDAGIIFHSVEAFAYLLHARLGDRLQAQEQLLTSTSGCRVQKFVILGRMDSGLAAPPLAIRRDGAKQLFCIFLIPRRCCRPRR